jgi:PAS domain S-box-containing protein
MQSLREEMQSSQEELKSSNEELQSTNEELQSTNEELTTSKEEMQSLNEELQTVNAELQSKVEDLSWVNNDMENLLNSTEIATVFLDNALHVRRFTEFATHLFKLIPGDVGRPLSDVVSNLDYAALHDDAREVLRTLVFIEKLVTTNDACWFKVRIMPYRTRENVIDGVVITFVDITNSKQVEAGLEKVQEELKKSLVDLERFFSLSEYMVCIASSEGTFQKVSPAFTETLGFSEKELIAQPFVDFVHPDDKKTTLDKVETLARGIPVIKFPNRYICKDGSYKWLEWTARSFVNGGDIYAIAYNVTGRELTDATLREALAVLQGSYTDQTTELNTAKTLETVLNTTQSILEKRLKDQTAGLGQVKADFKS